MNWPFPPSAAAELIGEPFASSSDLSAWAGRARATGELHRPSFPNEYLNRAIKLAGNQAALAARIGVKPNCISHWLFRKRVPVKAAPAIEGATAGNVTAHDLLPTVFPRPLVAPLENMPEAYFFTREFVTLTSLYFKGLHRA